MLAALLSTLIACQRPPAYPDAAELAIPGRLVDIAPTPRAAGAPVPPSEQVRDTNAPEVRRVTLDRDTRTAVVGGDGARWAFRTRGKAPATLVAGIGAVSGSPCFTVWIDEQREGETCPPVGDWKRLRRDLPAGDHRVVLAVDGGVGAFADPRVLPDEDSPRPDVVLVILDTTRWDHLGAAGYDLRSTSPVLDRWAKGATVYTNARAPSPWTAPSIGSILTGLGPTLHGAGGRRVGEAPGASDAERKANAYNALIGSVPTLASRLRGAGYETVALSANGFFSYRNGLDSGFSRFVSYSARGWEGAREGAAEAASVLRNRVPGAPTFLAVHFVDPHHPYTMRLPPPEGYAPPADLRLVQAGSDQHRMVSLLEPSGPARRHPGSMQVLYDAEIRWLDEALQAVFEAIPDDALVVVVADHGEAFGEHGEFMHGNTLYDELLRVPLFVRIPGQTGLVDAPVSSVDITPTLLSRLGYPAEGLTGLVLPAPGAPARGEPRVFYSESMYDGPNRTAAFDGRWKYILTHASGGGDRSPRGLLSPTAAVEELYDLASDPAEKADLAAAAPAEVERLRALVQAHLGSTWPGMHVRCAPVGPMAVRVKATSGAIGRVGPLTLEPGDTSRLLGGAVVADLFGGMPGDTDWLTLLLEGPGTLDFSGWPGAPAQVSYRGGPGAKVPANPPAAPPTAGACQVWEVGDDGGAPAVDAADLAELKELGYVE